MSGHGRQRTRRVAITGIGVVSPIGTGVANLWHGALAGTSAVRRITRFDAEPFHSRIAAELDDLEAVPSVPPKHALRYDRYSLLGVLAGLQALSDAGLTDLAESLRERAGIYLGSALGGVAFAETQHTTFLAGGVRKVDPALAISMFGGAASTNLAIALGLHGPNIANAN